MKIISFFPTESGSFVDTLSRDLTNEEGELFLVCAEYMRPETNDTMADFKGLNLALTLNPEVSPIVFCSIMPESYFLQEKFDTQFRALMARKRTCFMQLPFDSEELVTEYKKLLADKKEVDILAIEINQMETFEYEMGTIQHCVQSFFRDDSSYAKERIAHAVSEARKIGATGTDEEIASQIKNFKRQPKNSIFAGKYFPGVFCDIEGTLIIDGKVNTLILSKLGWYSKSKPITLWTGGKLDEIKKILLSNNITWKLVSKTDFAGAEVEIAFDDIDSDILLKEFGITVKEFHKI